MPIKPLFFTRALPTGLVAAALTTLATSPSRAEQFVLFDATFDYTWEDAINATPSKSHYYVKEANGLNLQRPDNWVSPVDYRNGVVHIHLEVLQKPAGGQMQGWALCYVGNAGSYGCPYTDYYTDTGVYEKEVDMTDFYNNDTIDWSQGIRQVDLVYTINGSGQGHVHFFPELQAMTTPTKVRIALVQVSAGSTYDPTALPGAGGAGGAGGGGGTAGQGGSGTGGVASGVAGNGTGGGAEPPLGGMSGTATVLPMAGTNSSAGSGGASGSAGAGAPSVTNGAPTSSGDQGGCSVSGGSDGRRSWLLALALALAGIRRRRSRA